MINVIRCIFMLYIYYIDYTYVYMPIFNVNGNHSGGRPFPHGKRWWMLRFIVALHQIPLTCPTGHDPVAMVCCFLRGERLKQVRRWSQEFDPVGDACNDWTVLHVLRVRDFVFWICWIEILSFLAQFQLWLLMFAWSRLQVCLPLPISLFRNFSMFRCLVIVRGQNFLLILKIGIKKMRRGTAWPASHSE